MFRILLITGLLWLSVTTAHAQQSNLHFQRGARLLGEMEDARAAEAFARALEQPGNSRRALAVIHLHIGICRFNLIQPEAAAESFTTALSFDPTIRLPPTTSPRMRAFFEQLRIARERELAAKMPTTAPATQAASQPASRPVAPPRRLGVSTKPADEATAPRARLARPARRSSINWPAWIAAGAAGAAGCSAVVLGLLSRSEASKANDLSLTYFDGLAHHNRAQSEARAANILWVAAGVTALGSALLFLLRGKSVERPPAVAVLPVRSGWVAQVEGAAW